MTKTKIEWADYVWNPVRGCKTGCPYCYAKRNNDRFWEKIVRKENSWRTQHLNQFAGPLEVNRRDIKDFMPTWLWSAYYLKFPDKPARIFVNSMSDIHYWKSEWMKRVLRKINRFPQHTFLFLTKNINTLRIYDFPSNCWLGVSIDTRESVEKYWKIYQQVKVHDPKWLSERFFISAEPMKQPMWGPFLNLAKWIVVGAETGSRTGKRIPSWTWIELIREVCDRRGIPLFMKDNLAEAWGDVLIQQLPNFQAA